ncbi:hypothetical protein C2G38_2098322 [Gigaspora rosea]|uniref:Protein kinase domain-containing protein n=1 Tax=Gigaspora rosea TaxID=44941 RepID=A0A397UT70_9GLOM|nr:hypothetical protein C2G38_2098322 [Gigaspora rosea]
MIIIIFLALIIFIIYYLLSYDPDLCFVRGSLLGLAFCFTRISWLLFLYYTSSINKVIIFLSGSNHSFIQIIVRALYFEIGYLFFSIIGLLFNYNNGANSFILVIILILAFFFPTLFVCICPYTNISWLINSSCLICQKNKTHIAWCQECATKYFKDNFDNWTSGNQKIDKIIKKTQMNSKFAIDFIEWIPYEQFEQIKEINRGGFGTIYSAVWKQGPLCMNAIDLDELKKFLDELKTFKLH